MNETQSYRRVNEAFDRASAHSPFLRMQMSARPNLAEALRGGGVEEALLLARAEAAAAPDTAAALRRERGAFALALAIGDLAGLLPLERVVSELSDLADRSISRAIECAIGERTPGVKPRGFAAIALGKLGSRELNYSSDVDLLFLFDPKILPARAREDPGQAGVRIAQRVIELLQKRTEDGYAFRVDLRLRPSPEVTPLALPLDAALSYYESSALPWERAAFVRARMAAGDAEIGRYFLDSLHPFVWRRSLDFGAVEELQAITRRIRGHYAEGQRFGPGYDLKRGRGGIREIEFFVQIHQLIHGGREPALRTPATLDAITALAEARRIEQSDAVVLAGAYRLLRTIEHRLQMVEDKQTHTIPGDPEALENVARLHGLEGGDALLRLIEPSVARVGAIYDALAESDEEALPYDAAALEARLRQFGFGDPATARARIESWRSGKARSLRTAPAREAFEAMMPALVQAFAGAPDPIRAMNLFDDVVERLPSGVNFYRLLQARPGLTGHLATILSHAPALAEQLGRRPELLDGLIDASAFEPARPVEALVDDFAEAERADEDYQLLLDRIRRRVNEARFALGVQLILRISDPLEVAAGYARVAEAALQVLGQAALREFERVHGRIVGSDLLILGLGRLGGRALTHASDLDLIYLFSGSYEAESDGRKPLRATDYFNRLAPRVSAALSVPTAAGPLYEVDTRLRPSGKDGLIAVSVDSFAEYQRTQAWTWEHMALTRARPVFGPQPERERLEALLRDLLEQPRDAGRTVADAVRMRREMAAHKKPKGEFDIKLCTGGLVDLEFAVHALQLIHHKGLEPELDRAVGSLVEAKLIPPEMIDAHRLLTRMLVTLRLASPSCEEPPMASRALVAGVCGHEDWDCLLAAFADARQRVASLWREVAAQWKEPINGE